MSAVFLILIVIPNLINAVENFKVDIHGYISQGFLFSSENNFLADTKNGTFQFNEFGINFGTVLNERVRLGIQFAGRDLGDTGNDKIIIDWAYADYDLTDWIGLRAGKMKLPFGFYNKTRDIDMLRTFILLPQGFYNDIFRDIYTAIKGVGLYGMFSLKKMGTLSYQLLLGTTEIDTEGSINKTINGMGFLDVEKSNVNISYNGSIIWETPLKGLRVGMTLNRAKIKFNGAITQDIYVPIEYPPYAVNIARKGDLYSGRIPKLDVKTYSLEYTWNNLVLATEYMNFYQKWKLTMSNGYTMDIKKSDGENYYVSGSYRFCDWFEFGSYYSVCYLDKNNKTGVNMNPPYSAYQKDICTTLRFDLNSHTTFKLENHFMNGTAQCYPQDNLNALGVPEFKKNWILFAAKMSYSF